MWPSISDDQLKQIKSLEICCNFIKSRNYDKFWQVLGASVTNLIISPKYYSHFTPPDRERQMNEFFNQFRCLKKIKIPLTMSRYLSIYFFMINKNIEVELYAISDYKFCISNKDNIPWTVDEDFIEIFKRSSTVKKISFPCDLPCNAVTRDKVIAYFSKERLRVNEVVFDFATLASCCYISKMEIEIVENEGNTKVAIVKVVHINITWTARPERPHDNCDFARETVSCQTVEQVTILPRNFCRLCMHFVYKSFPNVKRFHSEYTITQPGIFQFMSISLPFLEYLYVSYYEELSLWPIFDNLKYLNIKLMRQQSSDGFVNLCKSCPNLEEFQVAFLMSTLQMEIDEKTIHESVGKHLIKLQRLEIDPKFKLGIKCLQKTCRNLKRLKSLSCGYKDDVPNLLELFGTLPNLEVINYIMNRKRFTLTREDYQLKPRLDPRLRPRLRHQSEKLTHSIVENTSRDALEILPEEIWTDILQDLDIQNQRNCRLVCNRWWNILSSHPNLERKLELYDCYLSVDSNPVKMFSNTKFNYNELSIEGRSIICNGDLSHFWHYLGETIQKLHIGSISSLDTWVQLTRSGLTIENLCNLQSIEFSTSLLFYEMISRRLSTVEPILRRVKELKCRFFSGTAAGICPDMPMLEYIEVKLHGWRELVTLSEYVRGHCLNLRSLHIESSFPAHDQFARLPADVHILHQLKNLKICGIPQMRDIHFFIKNSSELQSLTIRKNDQFAIDREIAKDIFVTNSNLQKLLFMSEKNEVEYKLVREGIGKNVVEYNYLNGRMVREILPTENRNNAKRSRSK